MTETVYVPPARTRNPYSNYHREKDCAHGPQRPVTWALSKAQQWDFTPCWACAGGERADTTHSRSHELEQKLLDMNADEI